MKTQLVVFLFVLVFFSLKANASTYYCPKSSSDGIEITNSEIDSFGQVLWTKYVSVRTVDNSMNVSCQMTKDATKNQIDALTKTCTDQQGEISVGYQQAWCWWCHPPSNPSSRPCLSSPYYCYAPATVQCKKP